MRTRLKFVLALTAVIAVLVIFIAPAVNLMPTAMRAWRAAQMLALAMIASAFFVVAQGTAITLCLPTAHDSALSPELIGLTCQRLC